MATVATVPDQAAPLTTHRRSLKALTGIRLFAAGYVVVYHTQAGNQMLAHGHKALGNFFLNGYLAVPLFFILSGFILAYTYSGQIEKLGAYRRFWEARFARIWPLYAISLFSMSIPSLDFPSWGKMLAALLMLQAWNPWFLGLGGVWNYVCWTLSVEAFFYLLFPWIQAWLERLPARGHALFLALSLAVCVAINSGVRSIGYPETGLYEHIPLPVLHLPEFLVGVGMGNLFLGRLMAGREKLSGGGAWTWVATILSLALLTRGVTAWSSLVVIAFAAMVYGLAAETTGLSRLLGSKAGVLGGGISYALYLMQLPVKAWVLGLSDRFLPISRSKAQIVSGLVLLLLSYVLFRWVEDPARRALRAVFARITPNRQPG